MKIFSQNIHVSDMKDGAIAEITSWSSGQGRYLGIVVQRWGDDLIELGAPRRSGWPNLFKGNINKKDYPECQVRILPPGTTLEI